MNRVIVGRLGSPFGVRGWIKVISFTDPKEKILEYRPWQVCINNEWQVVEILNAQCHGKGIIVQLAGFNDRDFAKTHTHCDIAIDRDQLPQLAEDDYYWIDLVGLTVVTQSGEKLGYVDHLIATGNNDVLIVHGDRERLIPYTNQVIIKVDLQAKQIIVDWDPSF